MNANGSRNRFFVRGSSPRWSPDGTRIAYLAQGEPKGQQIFVKYKGTEGSTQITRVERTPNNITWSPDGQFIAFTMIVPAKIHGRLKFPASPKVRGGRKSPGSSPTWCTAEIVLAFWKKDMCTFSWFRPVEEHLGRSHKVTGSWYQRHFLDPRWKRDCLQQPAHTRS